MTKNDYINSIRAEYNGMKDMPRESLASSVRTLADDLYAKDSHFIFELIQNAEDNIYPDNTAARLRFEVCELDIEGQKTATLIVHNNEVGFDEKNVRAICQVGRSTKNKAQGYIGEKGIGFKSVFRITSNPYIFSNGFQFCLPERDDETGLGYIVPLWVTDSPLDISVEETSIVLPLNKNTNDTSDIIKSLREIAPETILFLKKLSALEVSIQLSNDITKLTIEKNVLKTINDSQLIELIFIKEEPERDKVINKFNYWLTEIEYKKPNSVHHAKRTGIESRVVSVAIPLDDKSCKGKLFAYLPVWEETGIPFLINGDFLLVSSRESIREDEEWNIWLRECIVKTYTSSFLALLNTPETTFEMKLSGYASVPIETHHSFLEPVVETIKEKLSESECVLTLPHHLLVKPAQARLCYQNFRELLEIKYLPAHLINTAKLVYQDMEAFSGKLKAIGVKQFTLPDILFCLEDTKWLKSHELMWFIKLYRYLKTQKIESVKLQKIKIIPIKGSKTTNLSCDTEQPIYLSIDANESKALEEVPIWLSKLVPITALDSNFEELLNAQKDHEELKKWLLESLRVYAFSKENFCVDVVVKFKAEIDTLDLEQIIDATQWLEQNVSDDFNWDSLPVILSDRRKMLLVEAHKQNLVVPETHNPESGWQNIWSKTEDRTHFVALNNAYSVMKKEWFRSIKARDFPTFKSVDYPYNTSLVSKSEKKLMEDCKSCSAASRYYNTKISSFVLPFSLQCFPKETHAIKLVSDSLLSYLFQINCSYEHCFHQEGLYAIGTYENRGTYCKYGPSSILEQLHQLKWFPTSKGYVKPSQAFLPKEGIKEIFEDTVPYFEGTLPDKVLELIQVRTEVTVTILIASLRENLGSTEPNQGMIERIYKELFTRTERNNHNIKHIFLNESLIYVSSGKQGKKWFTSQECVWEDAKDILGNDFAYLQNKYSKMAEFFVNRLGVKERIDTECFAKRWLNLQDNPLSDLIKQRELLNRLYREIKLVALMPENERPGWWDDYFFDQVKLYSQSDTFCDADEIILPDDKFFQDMFKDTEDVQFVWYPEDGSFNEWVIFFRAFKVSMLSESVIETLVKNVDPEFVQINRYVTDSAVKMIASWLREKRLTEYNELLNNNVFEHLLLLRESSVNTDIEIEFCLETENYIYDSQKCFFPAFWDRNEKILYYNSEASKSKLAQVLAKSLTKNYKDLSDWIELVLGEDSTERIKNKNWNVPREINQFLSETISLSKSNEEPLGEVSTETTLPSFRQNENDESIRSEILTASTNKKNDHSEEQFKVNPKISQSILQDRPLTSSTKNNFHSSLPNIHHENSVEVMVNDAENSDTTTFDYIDLLESAFSHNGLSQYNESVTNWINNGDDGFLSKPSRRAEKLSEKYRENISKEPASEARRKEAERCLLEPPNDAVRSSLFEWYLGKCQICGDTWPKRDGYPYFVATYIVERQHKRWLDEPGNALCLCARHFAQWQLATKHAITEITEQISKFKLKNEGGNGELSIQFQLVDQNVIINFCERHALALRTLLDIGGR